MKQTQKGEVGYGFVLLGIDGQISCLHPVRVIRQDHVGFSGVPLVT